MQIHSHRFGALEIESREVIRFPDGIIGFPSEHEYVLLRKNSRAAIGWLQATTNPSLAFPVVSIDSLFLDTEYFEALADACAHRGFGPLGEDLAVMAIICALADGPASVNLLAPVVVKPSARTGAQIFLLKGDYSIHEPLRLHHPRPAPRVDAQVLLPDVG